MLKELKNYMIRYKIVSLFDLKQRFQVEPDLLRNLLAHWARKGRVHTIESDSVCKTRCLRCDPLLTERYRWL